MDGWMYNSPFVNIWPVLSLEPKDVSPMSARRPQSDRNDKKAARKRCDPKEEIESNYDYVVSVFILYSFYWWFKLWKISTSVGSYSRRSSISTFLSWRGRGKKDGKCMWPTISIFLGTSCLISLHGVEGLTWTLDPFPLPPPSSNRPRLVSSPALSPSLLRPSVPSLSASIRLSSLYLCGKN